MKETFIAVPRPGENTAKRAIATKAGAIAIMLAQPQPVVARYTAVAPP